LLHDEKLDIRLLSKSPKAWQWQANTLANCLTELKSQYCLSFQKALKRPYPPIIKQEYFKISSCEFYREYEVGVDTKSINTSLQEAINKTVNLIVGNFVRSEDYGHGAKKWFINNFNGEKFKGVEMKTYIKGRFLRLEVQFKQIPKTSITTEQPVDTLNRVGSLAAKILDTIDANLVIRPQIIDEHELLAAILNVLPRSKFDRRVQKLIMSLAENLTYTPSAFGKDQATKHQLTKLVAAGLIEPITEHFPKDTKRKRSLSYRLHKEWQSKGGQS